MVILKYLFANFCFLAVQLVGYGTDASLGDYWIVRNSWGSRWGEEGYFKLARNENNMCGVATEVYYPTD